MNPAIDRGDLVAVGGGAPASPISPAGPLSAARLYKLAGGRPSGGERAASLVKADHARSARHARGPYGVHDYTGNAGIPRIFSTTKVLVNGRGNRETCPIRCCKHSFVSSLPPLPHRLRHISRISTSLLLLTN